MKLKSIFRNALFVLALTLTFPQVGTAAFQLPWSTTFDCPEWNQRLGLSTSIVNCDGISGYGAWTTSNGNVEQITAEANFPGGGGGRGQRHWIGPGGANNSGSLSIRFSSVQPEIYIRWYQRYQKGFKLSGVREQKWLYSREPVQRPYLGWYNDDEVRAVDSRTTTVGPGSGGWKTFVGKGDMVSDGDWHWIEVHLKMDTNGSNGVVRIWMGHAGHAGTLVLNANNVNWGTGAGWQEFAIPENLGFADNTQDMYHDIDDIAVRTTGPIGPIGGGGPNPPVNLQVR